MSGEQIREPVRERNDFCTFYYRPTFTSLEDKFYRDIVNLKGNLKAFKKENAELWAEIERLHETISQNRPSATPTDTA